ncbi:MAG: hypothetical protein GY886_01805 [Gammaproteobacteria bacterium]|nr:hypothetical protein [Gammaproteobacteria bacterium]
MAIFTAAATALVGAIATAGTIAGSVTLFNIAVGVVAAGLAATTAKLLGVFEQPKVNGSDPGIKIQLPPATDNRVPRMYGRNFTGGIIIDAEIKNENKTMAYCLVISEYNDNDTWQITDIYRGDAKLNFNPSQPFKVASLSDPNATSSTNVADKIRVRVYAGGSASANQIFPLTSQANAYGGGNSDGRFTNWTSANTMEDLVFAIVEIDYDPENGLTGLGAMTFDITNNLNGPADVLLDYLTNDRYGAGLSSSLLDQTSITDWETYCNTLVDYTDSDGNPGTHNRYEIDGALSTFNDCKSNIDRICLSSGAWFTYNNKTGKFGVVAQRPATTSELALAFEFTDENIISSVDITSTELYSLYNSVEVEFPSVINRDQTDVYFADIPSNIRHPNEPDNVLKTRLEMVNSRSRVSQLANIDLNQSRVSTVVEVTGDFSTLVVDVGDVVKVTLADYGFSNKLFRVMRTTEDSRQGVITVKHTLLEYDADVYGDIITQDELPQSGSGITNWWIEATKAEADVGNIYVVSDPTTNTVQRWQPTGSNAPTTLPVSTVQALYNNIYDDDGTYILVEMAPPGDSTYDIAKVTVRDVNNINNQGSETFSQAPSSTDGGDSVYFDNSDYYPFLINSNGFNRDSDLKLYIWFEDSQSGAQTPKFDTRVLDINLSNVVFTSDIQDNAVTEDKLDDVWLAGLQADFDNANANFATLTSDLSNLDSELTTLEGNLAILDSELDTLNNTTIPDLENNLATNNTAITANQSNITTLNTVTIPALEANLTANESAISNNQSAINTLNTVTLPALEVDITANENAINTLNNTTIPDLEANLSTNENAISTLNTVTIPDLEAEIAAVEANANINFPITETNIANGAISTPKLQTNAVTAAKIDALAVTAVKIAAGAITTAKIAAGNVTASRIATGTITSTQIAAGTITASEIASGTITSTQIAAGTITASNIQSGTITSTQIAAGTITASNIQSGTITSTQIATGTIRASNIQSGTITGTQIAARSIFASDIAVGVLTSTEIAAGAITSTQLDAGAVTAGKIATNAIVANNIQAGQIIAGKLGVNSVVANNIQAGQITAAKLSSGELITLSAQIKDAIIISSKIQNAAITTAKINNLAVNSAKIADLAVDTLKIQDNAVTIPLGDNDDPNILISPVYQVSDSVAATPPTVTHSSWEPGVDVGPISWTSTDLRPEAVTVVGSATIQGGGNSTNFRKRYLQLVVARNSTFTTSKTRLAVTKQEIREIDDSLLMTTATVDLAALGLSSPLYFRLEVATQNANSNSYARLRDNGITLIGSKK